MKVINLIYILTKFLTNCDVNTVFTVTLRQAAKATTSEGQILFRCDRTMSNQQDVSVLCW